MSGQVTECFYSGVEVLIRTQTGIIDVSDDVISVSVSRRKSAISTASVSLDNAGSYEQGKYSNGKYKLHPGDAVHIAFLKNTQNIEAFTGKICQCPAFGFYGASYDFSCEDAIGDLHYIYWDPFSNKAVSKYWTDTSTFISDTDDGAAGIQLNSFLQDVCGFPADMIKIAKFPNQQKFVNDIISSVTGTDVKAGYNDEALKVFKQLFGITNMSDAGTTDSKNGKKNKGGDVDGASTVVKHMLGLKAKASEGDLNKKLTFARGKTAFYWSDTDSHMHSGMYGLTREQMKKWAKQDKEAKDCSEAQQAAAMKAICLDISKGMKTENVPAIIYYYFTGISILKVKDKGDLSPTSSGLYIKLGGTEYKTKDRWTSYVNGVTESKTSSGDSMSKGSVPAPKTQTGDSGLNSKLDSFLKKHAAGTPSLDVDGFAGHQCWDLYLSYGTEVLGFKRGTPEMMQDAGGNGPFWDAMPKNDNAKKMLTKIPPNSSCRKGDIVCWRSSPGSGGYGHIAIVLEDKGDGVDCLSQGESISTVWRQTMPKNGSGYVLAGYLRPTGLTDDVSSSGDADGGSSSSQASDAADYAYKLFKYVTYVGQTPSYESEMLTGPLAMYNDKQALEFVSSLCKGSMREFMTLPDGTFAAFVPDYFGKLHAAGILNNELTIPQHEIVDYTSNFNKSMYTSHVYLLTREHMDNEYAMQISSFDTVERLLMSDGVVSLEKQGDLLLNLIDISVTGCTSAADMMQKLGVSIYDAQDQYIIDPTMTAIKALLIFMERWAACFSNSLQLTFRPEILPGIRLVLDGAGVTVFVESVTHSWNASSGGSTTVQISSPVRTSTGKVGV